MTEEEKKAQLAETESWEDNNDAATPNRKRPLDEAETTEIAGPTTTKQPPPQATPPAKSWRDLEEAAELVGSTATPPHGKSWRDLYAELSAFKQAHGHANPEAGHLAGWLACQRVLVRRGLHHSPVQIQLLRGLGCEGFAEDDDNDNNIESAMPPLQAPAPSTSRPSSGATTNTTTTTTTSKGKGRKGKSLPNAWEERFAQLEAYHQIHGTPNPPQTKGSPEADYKLAIWLNGQRHKFRKGTLELDKIQRLVELKCDGFQEGMQDKKKTIPKPKSSKVTPNKKQRKKVSWNERYLELKEFQETFGHAAPQYGTTAPEACQHLAQWLSNQRSDYRLGKKISEEQAQLLRDLGAKGFGEKEEEGEE